MNVLGVEFTPDVRSWSNAQRRVGSLVAIGAAALLVLVGLVTYAFARESAAILYWVLVGLVVLVLAYEIVVLVFGLLSERRAQPTAAGAAAAGAAAEGSAVPQDASYAPPAQREASVPRPTPRIEESPFDTVTLRCGDCGTVFDVTDTRERPLYHSCPGCAAEGVLREPAAAPATPRPLAVKPTAEAVPEPEPASEPASDESPWAPRGLRSEPAEAEPAFEPPAEAAEVAAPPPAVKRLKLRCGGCKQVFSLDDTGERPLESRCAHCGRKGVIR